MAELGRDLDLLEKALGPEGYGQFRPQDLDGYLAVMLPVLRQVDGRHPATTELTLERVTVTQSIIDALDIRGHGGLGRLEVLTR